MCDITRDLQTPPGITIPVTYPATEMT